MSDDKTLGCDLGPMPFNRDSKDSEKSTVLSHESDDMEDAANANNTPSSEDTNMASISNTDKNVANDFRNAVEIKSLSMDISSAADSLDGISEAKLYSLIQVWISEGNPIAVSDTAGNSLEYVIDSDGALVQNTALEDVDSPEIANDEDTQAEQHPSEENSNFASEGVPIKNNPTRIAIALLSFFVLALAAVALSLIVHKPADTVDSEPVTPASESIPVAEYNDITVGLIDDGTFTLFYDDRYSFEAAVSEINNQEVTSTVPGSDEPDAAVLKQDDTDENRVIAVGCGEADVVLENGEEIHVEVTAAPISLLLIAGQSNGEGRLADNVTVEQASEEYVLNEEGQAYDTYGVSDYEISSEVTWIEDPVEDMTIENYTQFLPESLTDNTKNGLYNSTNTITDGRTVTGKGGIDSALAYRWRELTGEKLWIVNAAHHGSKIASWQPTEDVVDNNFWQAVLLYQGAEKILSQEIEAGHYILMHKGVIWCQGERDYDMESDRYLSYFRAMVDGLKKELAGEGITHLEHEIEFTAIIMVRAAMDEPFPENDFLLTGPRLAQYYIASSQEVNDVFLASQIEDFWIDDEHVQEYFQQKYGTEEQYQQAYPTVSDALEMPRRTTDVHCGFHHSQRAYNEIGFDTAYNICQYMKYAESSDITEGTFQIVMEEGQTDVADTTVYVQKGVYVPMAVKVFPSYRQKEVIVECSNNIQYSELGIQLTNHQSGTITVTLGDVSKAVTIEPES